MVRLDESIGSYTPLLIAVVCVVAIGLSGATLTDASMEMVDDIGDGPIDRVGDPPTGDGSTDERTGGQEVGAGDPTDDQFSGVTTCIEILQQPLVVLGLIIGFFGFVTAAAYRYSIAFASLFGLTIIPPLWVGYFLLTNCPGGGITGPASGGGAMDVTTGAPVTIPLPAWVVLLVVLGVLVVGGAVILWGASGDEEFGPVAGDEQEDEVDESNISGIGVAAGEAADRIEYEVDADVDNEVYLAWKEMTEYLDVPNPDSSTPAEFANVAIDAGMETTDVRELTDMFEEIRYSEAEVSSSDEREAVEILRRIENEYAMVEDDEVAGGAEADRDSGAGDAR